MPWSLSQSRRLAIESRNLERSFDHDKVKWINPTGDTQVEVKVTCSNGKNYTIRVYLPSDFPNSCPEVVVISLSSGLLARKDGSLMSMMNGYDHILSSKDGYTQICHFRPHLWRDNNTIHQVIMKGLHWLEAYELYLLTGASISLCLQACESFFLDGVVMEL